MAKRYLTVKEFVKFASSANNIIIDTNKGENDGRSARPRCKCFSPVTNLRWENGCLEWSDQDSDPHFVDLTDDTVMNNITDDEEYYTSCYIEKETTDILINEVKRKTTTIGVTGNIAEIATRLLADYKK